MSKPKKVIKTTTLTFNLAIMFVIGWVFGILGYPFVDLEPTVGRVCQFIFIVIVGFHGFFIFLLQPCRSQDARNVWIKWFYYITCRRGKIPVNLSSAPQNPNSREGAAATKAGHRHHGKDVMSSIAERFGCQPTHASEIHVNGNTDTEDPRILKGTYSKAKPTRIPVVKELVLHGSGSSDALSTSYSSFVPSAATHPPVYASEVPVQPCRSPPLSISNCGFERQPPLSDSKATPLITPTTALQTIPAGHPHKRAGGEKPRVAPRTRTGKAGRPLPPLPVSHALENKHVEESL
jgi:hypothetical protein